MADRPISPHLQIYKWQITSILSILHRLTGILLFIGLLGLIYILHYIAAHGPAHPPFYGGPFFSGILDLLTVGFIWHTLLGIRYFFYDWGIGLSLTGIYRSGGAVIITGLILTGKVLYKWCI